jgi:phytoene synthase
MRQPDPSPTRSLARLYSSATQRPVLATLLTLEREIGASLRPGLDHQVAHTRLAWWREECARTAAGRPTHPLTRELAARLTPPLPEGPAPLAALAGFVDTAVWDLSCATFDTRRELTGYCERWSAAMIAPLLSLALPAVPAAQARALGVSLREIELLLALATDARAGRLRLPLDELEHAHIAPERLAQPPWPEPLAELLRHRYQGLRVSLGAALAELPSAARPALRGVIVWATLASAAAARAEKRLPRASAPRDHHAPLDGWRAWRVARRADARGTPARGGRANT